MVQAGSKTSNGGVIEEWREKRLQKTCTRAFFAFLRVK
jgi:hypothetical protein